MAAPVGAQPPGDLGGHVHHVAVALQGHHLVDVHAAELDDPADVVASQVHEHDVLGDLLGVLDELGGHAPVLLLGAAPPSGAGDRARVTVPSSSVTRGSGEEPTRVTPGWRTKYMYGLGLTWRSTRYTSKGCASRSRSKRWADDDLEDVAGQDVLLGHLDRTAVALRAEGGSHVGQRLVRHGRIDQRLVDGPRTVGRQLVDARDGLVVPGVQLCLGEVGIHQHVLDQRHALAPVVVGGQLTDHGYDGVGMTEVVGRHVGKVLDLSYDVVAEVPHDPAVERREVVQHRRPPGLEEVLDGRQDPLVGGYPLGEGPGGVDRDDHGRSGWPGGCGR